MSYPKHCVGYLNQLTIPPSSPLKRNVVLAIPGTISRTCLVTGIMNRGRCHSNTTCTNVQNAKTEVVSVTTDNPITSIKYIGKCDCWICRYAKYPFENYACPHPKYPHNGTAEEEKLKELYRGNDD